MDSATGPASWLVVAYAMQGHSAHMTSIILIMPNFEHMALAFAFLMLRIAAAYGKKSGPNFACQQDLLPTVKTAPIGLISTKLMDTGSTQANCI